MFTQKNVNSLIVEVKMFEPLATFVHKTKGSSYELISSVGGISLCVGFCIFDISSISIVFSVKTLPGTRLFGVVQRKMGRRVQREA